MSVTLLHFHWHHGHATESLGALQFITPRRAVHGEGHHASLDVHFQNAVLEIPSAQMVELLRRGQEALVAQSVQGGVDVSGAVANIGDAS